MFIMQTMRIMAGPYLCSLADMYYANQDILNTIVVVLGCIWIFYKRFSKHSTVSEK